ncbi:MAG: hypothetical protein M3Y41_10365, partial [Pseudomonadota bacterium]|nr:hypothetical protein [Pseudomonadota bacterium]
MNIPSDQHEVVAFLRRLSAQEPIETHISAVFVGSHTAWKMKKSVRLPFLDFTSLPDRRRFLGRELELNKPGAPEIYRDVAAVVRGPHGPLAITPDPGDRTPLEWVLRMAPVPAPDFLDVVAARGGLTPAVLDALGDSVARYHARLAPVFGGDGCHDLQQIAAGNAEAALAAGLPAETVRDWS